MPLMNGVLKHHFSLMPWLSQKMTLTDGRKLTRCCRKKHVVYNLILFLLVERQVFYPICRHKYILLLKVNLL